MKPIIHKTPGLLALSSLPVIFLIVGAIWGVIALIAMDDPPAATFLGPVIFVGVAVISAVGLTLYHRRYQHNQRQRQAILEFGTATTATIVNVKPNYTVRVSRKYVLSDIQLSYSDMYGQTHQPKQTIATEEVERMDLRAGDVVNIKYDTGNASRFVIVNKT